MRTETLINSKDPKSVQRKKKRIFTDINGIMRGNPHALIRDFTTE